MTRMTKLFPWMMTTPIHRYSEAAAVDGSIFAFAQGTDPKAFSRYG